ncbi:TetR/AcrR family transcriptional regulator [Pyxidicoccus sp. MSG2]|uniref:TetR/AcrR family transcriptional regulator n=1 Tax=Pyxidicoccus sp. MSG2 TaxID=2996790 RepID=UPI00226E4AAA|nr:TetR/AcrR family transcriptional regulator [Pyxidicoccus sp. MSG2]MCY1014609.1 TetR/AcrR family transcriptional regulator [Pyxidicoccus sp. MSG2]
MSSDPRTAILDAAGEIFVRFGFKKASVEEIARRAGVGKGTIYLYFESKEALFEACVRLGNAQAVAELEAAVRRATTPELQVRAFIHCKLEQIARIGEKHRMKVETLFELGEEALRLMPELQEKEAALLARILAEGTTQGAFAVASPDHVATGLVETLSGLTVKLLTHSPERPLKAALDSFFEVFVRGLAAPRPRPHSKS